MDIKTVSFTAFIDQSPGTSGLRKSVKHFQQPHYTESFIQAIFSTLGAENKTIVLGGDGRFYNETAIQIVIKMAAAQGVKRLIIGENGLLSTPAASHIIRHYQADYGIILSASHNPGGENGDFGIKFNLNAGQPAPESATNAVFETSKQLKEYTIADITLPALNTIGQHTLGTMTLDIISSTEDYADLMEQLFDFDKIRQYLSANPIIFDAMHAATGPYAKEIFSHRLGLPEHYLINTTPLPDFGGGHPDPQPSHAQDLQAAMQKHPEAIMGAASDGDGDRNLIMGRKHFVNPCDSLAIIADRHTDIACLAELTGIGRTMPTSRAIDAVAQAKQLACYETPTGWKFFANLLDANKIQLCGEESFGTGGNHIREKDGIWTILCWLSLLAQNQQTLDTLLTNHWNTYGRHHFNRFDYTELDKNQAQEMINAFEQNMRKHIGSEMSGLTVTHAAQFNYTDPTNNEISPNQGLQIQFGQRARIICRLSGTDTRGATLRLYCEYWQQPGERTPALVGTTTTLATLAQNIMDMQRHIGRSQPNNIA
ncbi:alpha-D-glucose phosphate-specific phosphoglucomutase [Suttonella ornithocola]|uniref:phosphoglucomutase (alpha-D-glucose-1,6-bisphosphate-dependent) n=1 Tax=Suttonella ornithocola TaxID=279832 RepID=A0A380MP04_9GAMM|nr:alpha-D-glucose phosphate-specific phosphoglucomutase [Suttonella ornithocola]SUO93623.1 Phosphoglucomutase [Suttonella ornithocola]